MDIKLLRERKHRETKIATFELAIQNAATLGDLETLNALKYIHSLDETLFELQTSLVLDTESGDKLIVLLLVNGLNVSDETTRAKAVEILLKQPLPSTITTPFALNYKNLGISGFKATVPKELQKNFLRAAKQSPELLVQLKLNAYFTFIPQASSDVVYNGFSFEISNFKIPKA